MTEFTSKWLTWEPPETLKVDTDKTAKRASGTFGTSYSTHSQGNEAAPALSKEWATAAAQLQRMNRPATVGDGRWQQVRSDTTRLLDWVPMLEAMDWTVADVFGRDDLDRRSLAWKVRGQRVGPVTSIATTLRGIDGSVTHVYRRDSAVSADSAFTGTCPLSGRARSGTTRPPR